MVKQAKPYPQYPLTPHANGQFVKKIGGRLVYFGSDPQAALDRYLAEKDELFAGRQPGRQPERLSVKELIGLFLDSKQELVQSGEITERSLEGYHETCKRVGASLGLSRPVAGLTPQDFQKLRADLRQGKTKQLSNKTLQGELTRARVLFKYAQDNGLVEKLLLYRPALKAPKKANLPTFRTSSA